MLTGVIPILATPFTGDDRVDVPALSRVAEFAVASGATAVATLGMASEAFALSEAERTLVVGVIRASIGPQVPLIAGVAATSRPGALAQGTAARQAGADGLMVLPPFLVKPTRQGLISFYQTLGEDLGNIMVQDAPQVTGVAMPPDLIAELAALPGITSFKIETPDSPAAIQQIHRLAPQATLLGGRNAVEMPAELAAGSVGTMPACEFTGELSALHAGRSAGKDIKAAYARLLPLLSFGVRPGKGWAVHKHLLHRRGVVTSTAVRFPAEPLTTTETAELDQLWDTWQTEGNSHA
ncbi:MAG: dihydrodipicolinate synthase family protein [Propioniciclava sp.]